MRRPNQVVNREDLLSHLWDFNYIGFSNVVDVHVKNLRRKLGEADGRQCIGNGPRNWLPSGCISTRNDPFFRTEVNVVALQAAFALTIIALIGVSFSLVYHNISVAIVEGIQASLSTNAGAAMGPAIVQEIEQIRSQNLWIVISIVAIVTVIFGYIIARVTLKPARDALSSQKQFIGNVAHELRTPLAVIKANTEVALMDATVAETMREMLVSNVEELDRISQIINNLLSLSALVRPEGMEFGSVDFSALITSVVEKYEPLAKGNELEVTVRKAPNLKVWGNRTALEQIVGNVLKNAINYTRKGGRIRITVELALNNSVELIIQDSGIGIARKDLFRIFEPFYRAEPSRNAHAGSGPHKRRHRTGAYDRLRAHQSARGAASSCAAPWAMAPRSPSSCRHLARI